MTITSLAEPNLQRQAPLDNVFLENRIQKLNLKYNVKTSEVAKLIYISFGY
jgi:hypothetical protein